MTLQDDYSHKNLRHMMWRRGNLRWKLDSLQESIIETIDSTGAKKILILSSRQIGKSFLAVIYALEFLIRNPNRIARIIAPTRSACDDIVNDNLSRILVDAPEDMVIRRPGDMRWEVRTAQGTGSLRIGALERQYVDKNRGGNASLVIYEEPGFVSADDFAYGVDSVIGPQLLRSKGVELFVTTPSVDPEHPIHTKIKPQTENLGTFFSYTVYDSPSITPEMIEEAIKRCGGEDTDAFQREYMARIIRASQFICVPSFYAPRHVVAFEAPRVAQWQVMIDWGGVKDLTVAGMHTYDYIAGKHLFWDELVFEPNTSSDVIAAALIEWEAAWFKSHQITVTRRFADVFSQTSIDLAAKKYPVTNPQKTSWLSSVNNMAVKFSQNEVLVHPRCVFLQKSLRGGMFNKQKNDFARSEISYAQGGLGHCDGLAMIMYAFNNQSTASPYTDKMDMPESVMVLKSPQTEQEKMAQAFDIKTWGTQRTFGAFRK